MPDSADSSLWDLSSDASTGAAVDEGFGAARSARRVRLTLLGAVLGGALGVFGLMMFLDLGWDATRWRAALVHMDQRGAAEAMGPLGEVMSAVLGLSLTVVAIVVQLASQRYPAKIVDLFMRDRVNAAFFGLMAGSCIYVVLAPTLGSAPQTMRVTLWTALALTTLNFALLLPYFAHVFTFLEPTNIITQLRERAWAALKAASVPRLDATGLTRSQRQVSQAIDRIADNSMAAVTQHDRHMAIHTVRTLEELLCGYLGHKPRLPEGWARLSQPTLTTLAKEFQDEIIANNTWVEAKTLMELERILRAALSSQMSEMVSQVAVSTRHIGEAALGRSQPEALALTIQFFNTYMRHTLNQRNVRAAYNVLYEYRRFATSALRQAPASCVRIIEHMVYYGRTANGMGLPFVTVTVAHDVRVLCEQGWHQGLPEQDLDRMLELFLSLDQPSDDEGGEVALLGVRRAQSILGAFFLELGAKKSADLIRRDMSHEPQGRLIAARDTILAVKERKFWEVTDRGFNFDYVEPERRPFIHAFYEPLLRAR